MQKIIKLIGGIKQMETPNCERRKKKKKRGKIETHGFLIKDFLIKGAPLYLTLRD